LHPLVLPFLAEEKEARKWVVTATVMEEDTERMFGKKTL
jgi:hypothetical protein